MSIGEDSQLTKAVAGTHHVDALTIADDVGVSFLQHHELVAGVALTRDDLIALGCDFVGQPSQLAPSPDRQVTKDVDLSKPLCAVSSELLAVHVSPSVRGLAFAPVSGDDISSAWSPCSRVSDRQVAKSSA